MIVIDVEASGVDSRIDSLVSVGAVDFEHPENRFYEECRIWEGAHVEKEALAVNGFTLEEIQPQYQRVIQADASPKRDVLFGHASALGLVRGLSSADRSKKSRAEDKKTDREVVVDFLAWLGGIKEKTIAGHNPSFDRDFLEQTAHRYHINWPLAHRTLDLHSICWYDMLKRGASQPTIHDHSALNLDAILKYVGIPEEPKPHNALTGALVETEAFGRLFYEKPYLAEFSAYSLPKR